MKKFCLALLIITFSLVPGYAATTCSQVLSGPPCPGGPGIFCVNNSWVASLTQGVTYNIYRSGTSGGENYIAPPLNTAPVTTTTYQDVNLPSGATVLYYTAVAVGSGGQSSVPSAEACAQIPMPIAPPTAMQSTPQ